MDQSVITRVVTVAGGRFAPGHLGELTQQVPFEMVDAVLEETCRLQRRVRDLPARVVVYLLLAGCLFAELGYPQVWARLTAGLGGLPFPLPAASAMTQARRRLGPGPLRALFFLLRGPSPADTRWRGLLVCALDGTVMTVADSARTWPSTASSAAGRPAGAAILAAAAGPGRLRDPHRHRCRVRPDVGRRDHLRRGLTRSLHAGMLLLADRSFGCGPLARKIAAAEADFLIRVRTGNGAPGLPVLRRLPDGSWLSLLGGVPVRVIDAAWTVTTSAGTFTSECRLVTTLTDPARYPACDLAVLYHERWEIETAYLELKSTILGGRVLRARTPDGVEQEVYALLVTYQALRAAIADAASTVPGTDPDRASFTIALNTARDQVTLAAGVIAGARVDLAGRIGRLVLAASCPPGGCGSAPASSSAPSPSTTPGGKSTARLTKPPSTSSSSPPICGGRWALTDRPCGCAGG